MAALIGALVAVFAAGLSVTAYLVFVMQQPLISSATLVPIIGGGLYMVAALFGIVGGMLGLIVSRYPLWTQFLLPLIYAALAGMIWGDRASGNSPHISKVLAEITAAASWAITALVVVMVWVLARRFVLRRS